MAPDLTWQGPIAFHELLFGCWLVYITLVLVWERLLKEKLPEWKYMLLVISGASFFVINHYYFFSPFYVWLINSYSLVYYLLWYWIGLRQPKRSSAWKVMGMVYALASTVVFVGYEMLARFIVNKGVHESWVLVVAFAGLIATTYFRGRSLDATTR
jgi:uncharacterized membrane protein SirB2